MGSPGPCCSECSQPTFDLPAFGAVGGSLLGGGTMGNAKPSLVEISQLMSIVLKYWGEIKTFSNARNPDLIFEFAVPIVQNRVSSGARIFDEGVRNDERVRM